MESIKKAIAQVMSQMNGMTLSQRLALLMGAVLVAGSVVWMAQWAAEPDMVPLIATDLSAEELAAAQSGLDRMGEPYEIQGSKILVRASTNRSSLMARLQQEDALPSDTSLTFKKLIEDSDPFASASELNRRYTIALQGHLARGLSGMESVKNAEVYLNIDSKTGFGPRNAVKPTASVMLEMKGGVPVSRKLGIAAQRFVAGAVKGLTAENVSVIDNLGQPVGGLDDEEPANAKYREQVEREKIICQNIRQMVADPLARIRVRVELNYADVQSQTTTMLDGVLTSEKKEAIEETQSYSTGNPGVKTNTGVDMGSRTGPTKNLKSSSAVTEFMPGQKTERVEKPWGETNMVFAAVNLSDVYLANVYRKQTGSTDAPNKEQLQQVFEEQENELRDNIAPLLKGLELGKTDRHLDIAWHYEMDEIIAPVQAATMDDAMGMAKRYAPQSALGLLALVSLGFMLRMAKKTNAGESFGMEIGLPAEAIEAAKKAAADANSASDKLKKKRAQEQQAADDELVGTGRDEVYGAPMAEATEGVLVAQEVDETSVQVNKMVEQVSDFVNDDTETVANLFERWVESSE